MKFKILNRITSKLIALLEGVGRILNQNPSPQENKKASKRGLKTELVFKNRASKAKNERPLKTVTKAKGSPNTDANIFNHPRKDIPVGRHH